MKYKVFAIYVIMVCFVFMGSVQLYTFIMLQREPVSYQKVWTDTPEIKQDGVFRAHYALTRTRPCRTEVSVFMEKKETRQVVMRQNYIGGARKTGVYQDILLAFQLPPPSEKGCYIFSTTAINYCAEGLHIITAPPLDFCVVD
jgi:hypothetical protein